MCFYLHIFVLFLCFVKHIFMERLFRNSLKRIREVPLRHQRFLIEEIDWSDRMIAITGARGTGKTTLMLQYMRLNLPGNESSLYVSLDDLYFAENRLVDLVEDFVNGGGKYLFLDEIHKYPSWSTEIKNIYDNFSELKIVFSGSSLLKIHKGRADLSRRVSIYELPTLSYREYLALNSLIEIPPLSFENILQNHVALAGEVTQKIKPLANWKQYLASGNYPFFLETTKKYHERLKSATELILENDIPTVYKTDYQQIIKIKKLLYVISTSAPFKPNIAKLAEKTEMERKTVYKYLDLLERAGLINQLKHSSKGVAALTKPHKIFMANPNLIHLYADNNPETGNLRETFFMNQLKPQHQVSYTNETDFLVDNTYFFEIGGKTKTQKQIKDLENAFVVADNIETGFGNKIPLWLFGFLY